MIYTVSPTGGDFTSIQQAVDAVPAGEGKPTIILIRAGEYRERVVGHKPNLRFVGEDAARCVLTWSAAANDVDESGQKQGTFLSYTLLVAADHVEFENLTVLNEAGDGRDVGQAVAVYAAGDCCVFRSCRLIAHQDTLFCGPIMPKVARSAAPREMNVQCVQSVGDCPPTHARQYYENCYIQGDVDFIFGPYRCWFEGCTLYMNARGGFYTAANTPKEQPFGFVFHACALRGECEDGAAYLGRPWRKYARTLFLNCDMDKCVAPCGFADWGEDKPINPRLGEYGTTGARGDLSSRDPRQGLLSAEEAACVNVYSVLGGCDDWYPHAPKSTWYVCGDSIAADYPPHQAPMTGWGQALGLLATEAFIENCAVCGRSSKSFVAQGRLSQIELCLRPYDKLLICFSHNDEKEDRLVHTEAYTTFQDYLNMYIDAAKRRGAVPILITPMPRRRFDESGRLLPTHGDYPAAMRALARERGVKLIDLEAWAKAKLEEEGESAYRRYYAHVPPGHPNYPEGLEDNSHLSRIGAAAAAIYLADQIP